MGCSGDGCCEMGEFMKCLIWGGRCSKYFGSPSNAVAQQQRSQRGKGSRNGAALFHEYLGKARAQLPDTPIQGYSTSILNLRGTLFAFHF